MPQSTVELWASKLVSFEYDDAEETARDVVELFDRMPSLKTFEDAIRETRKARENALAAVLPFPGRGGRPYRFIEHMAAFPDDRKRVEAMQGSLMGDFFAALIQQEMGAK